MQLYTIHHHYLDGKYGYEASQLTRMRFADIYKIPYEHLITAPQKEGWENRFQNMGFTYGTYINLPEWFFQEKGKWFSDTQVDYKIGKAFIQNDSWVFLKDGELYREEDVVVSYLADNLSNDGIIIRDESRIPMPKLVRLTTLRNISYYEYIHHRALDNGLLPVLNKKIHYFVASEQLSERLGDLGYQTTFLPPIVVNKIHNPQKLSIQRYIWSGHLGDYKNPEQLIRIFKALPDLQIDVYGGTAEEFRILCEKTVGHVPNNINHKGRIDIVPYWDYDGYISTSISEVFANSCVEAMSYGLKCIVSDLDYPYQYYQEQTNGEVECVRLDQEYIEKLKTWKNKSYQSKEMKTFVEKYNQDKWFQILAERLGEHDKN